MPLTEDDVREILRLIDESDVTELRIETESFSLHVRRGDSVSTAPPERLPPAPEAAVPESRVDGVVAVELHTIASPMLGVFYRAQAPGALPFVDVGKRVEPDTVVCLIEVMKMMNSVHAGVGGTIVEVCVENAQPVEYGTVLFKVQPD